MMGKDNFTDLSPIDAIHQTARGLYDAGVIDGKTMRTYDELCLPAVTELSAAAIKNKVSQSLLAKLLNVSISTVKQWELGKRRPHGASLKLLNIVLSQGLEPLRH
jgi:putative transcriptional regulator